MNVLVTGGAGFRGSHFVRALLADRLPGLEGASVTVLDNLTYAGSFANLGAVAHDERLDFVPGDVADAPLIGAVLRRHDTVVHFAGTDRPVAALATTNVTGTQVLLEAARRWQVTRFVHVSPGTVYGPAADGPWREDAPLTPATPHAAARAGADLLVSAYHRTYDLPTVTVRTADTYGPRQHPQRPVPRIVTALLAGHPAPPPDDTVRDWLHVDDHSRAVGLVLARGEAGRTYHVGGSVELSGRHLHELVVRECGAEPAPTEQTADGPRFVLDDDRIRAELSWAPQVEFETGLARTVQWYRDNQDWWRLLRDD